MRAKYNSSRGDRDSAAQRVDHRVSDGVQQQQDGERQPAPKDLVRIPFRHGMRSPSLRARTYHAPAYAYTRSSIGVLVYTACVLAYAYTRSPIVREEAHRAQRAEQQHRTRPHCINTLAAIDRNSERKQQREANAMLGAEGNSRYGFTRIAALLRTRLAALLITL